MNTKDVLEHQWPYLLSFIPGDVDLNQTARDFGAIRRKRRISEASDLLRLALAYGFCRMSLRQTAAWAEMVGLASISDVALLKRLRSASDWLGFLTGRKLAERMQCLKVSSRSARLRVVDATVVNGPSSRGTDWRVHMGLDLASLAINHIELTDASGGEQLGRFAFGPGDLVLADRGYAHRRGLAHVRESGAHFVVRTNWKNIPLSDCNGRDLDLLALVRDLPEAAIGDFDVRVKADARAGPPALDVRLVVLRKSEAAAEKSRDEMVLRRARQVKAFDPRSFEAAGYVFLLTSLPRDAASAHDVLEFYRWRWQIEMAFKRLKGLIHLGELPIRDPRLARSYLYAKFLAALLLDDFTERYLAFSPWGFDARRSPVVLVANAASAS
jgi:hypothetical protein